MGLDLIDKCLNNYKWSFHDIIQGMMIKIIPKKKKCKR